MGRLGIDKASESRVKGVASAVKVSKNLPRLLKPENPDLDRVKKVGRRLALAIQDLIAIILLGR